MNKDSLIRPLRSKELKKRGLKNDQRFISNHAICGSIEARTILLINTKPQRKAKE
jgi:hypothetical protein